MDRARRAEPYGSATTWTREVAKNLAGHLARISNAHSCVDTGSPKSTQLPKFQHTRSAKRCVTSPVKTRQAVADPLPASMEGSDGVPSASPLSGRRAGDSADNQADPTRSCMPTEQQGDAETPRRQLQSRRYHLGTPYKYPAVNEFISGNGRREMMHDVKRTLDKARLPGPARSKAPNVLGDSTYDCPPTLNSGKLRPGVEYKQKQAQLKIWQENQALAKRLRSTKPTLKSKDWERDDKWNQEFLKSQERRRSLLQTELSKAQAMPHTTIVRVRPLKLPHHEPSTMVKEPDECQSNIVKTDRCNTSTVDSSGALSARQRRSRSRTLGDEPLRDPDTQPLCFSAANHRRILHLRQQKRLHPTKDMGADQASSDSSTGNEASSYSTVDLNDDELVDVRFIFSRRRSRRTSHVKSEAGGEESNSNDADTPRDQGAINLKDLAGALPPGIERKEATDHVESTPTPRFTEVDDTLQSSENPAQAASRHIQAEDAKIQGKLLLSDAENSSSTDDAGVMACRQSDAAVCSETGQGTASGALAGSTCGSQAEIDEAEPLLAYSASSCRAGDVNGINSSLNHSSDASLPDQSRDVKANCAEGVLDHARGQTLHLNDTTEEQCVRADTLQAVVHAEGGMEARSDATAPEVDLHDATPSLQPADASSVDAEPEYRDDAFDDDYQPEEDHCEGYVQDTDVEEAPPATGSAALNPSDTPDDAGDSDEYGSEYEDNDDPYEGGDYEGDIQSDAVSAGELMRGEGGGDEQEEEEAGADGELEYRYSQDEFTDD